MHKVYGTSEINEAAIRIRAASNLTPSVGLVLGSGLNALAAEVSEATIIPLVCKDSIDERLENKVLPKKRRYAQAVMGGGHEVNVKDLENGLKINSTLS